MFHLFHWYVSYLGESIYLDNSLYGIEVQYAWKQHEWTFFLFPQIDQNQWTIKYFAFDEITQKERFLRLLKIQWVWGKSAYQIAMLPADEVAQAIESFDMKYFQKIQWVWPKTAKRLLVELKHEFSREDIERLKIDDRLYKDITSALQSLWYAVQDVKKLLPQVPLAMEKENLPEIMKWLIDRL